MELAYNQNELVMNIIGTGQQGSGLGYLKNMVVRNKICGVDIQYIEDAA